MQEFRQLWEMPNMYAPQARPGAGLDSTRRSSGETGKLKQVRVLDLHQQQAECVHLLIAYWPRHQGPQI